MKTNRTNIELATALIEATAILVTLTGNEENRINSKATTLAKTTKKADLQAALKAIEDNIAQVQAKQAQPKKRKGIMDALVDTLNEGRDEANKVARKNNKAKVLRTAKQSKYDDTRKNEKGYVQGVNKARKAATTKANKKVDEAVKEVKTRGRKAFRKVGDLHKNGKWMWTEYREGCFDWRNIKPAVAKS